MMGTEERVAELGLELPEPLTPVANYVMAKQASGLVFLAGHGPLDAAGQLRTGKLGADLDTAAGVEAARVVGLSILATLRHELGSLDWVRQVVKVFGMVNCTPDFVDIPTVINGCSDLLVEVFGDQGRHARSAVGMTSLPLGMAVEIEAVVQVSVVT